MCALHTFSMLYFCVAKLNHLHYVSEYNVNILFKIELRRGILLLFFGGVLSPIQELR